MSNSGAKIRNAHGKFSIKVSTSVEPPNDQLVHAIDVAVGNGVSALALSSCVLRQIVEGIEFPFYSSGDPDTLVSESLTGFNGQVVTTTVKFKSTYGPRLDEDAIESIKGLIIGPIAAGITTEISKYFFQDTITKASDSSIDQLRDKFLISHGYDPAFES